MDLGALRILFFLSQACPVAGLGRDHLNVSSEDVLHTLHWKVNFVEDKRIHWVFL